MTDYKLSIVIPTFNLEKTIEKTFHSVETQTIGFENIELIFIDDQSTDKTLKILNNYKKTYSNVKVFTTYKNSGFAGKPRNIGIENSTSQYILFLDGDDQLLIDSCEVLYNHITSTNSDIVIGGHINQYENKKLEHNSPLYSGRNEIFTQVQDANLLNITPAITAKLFKKELLMQNNIRFLEGIPGQDLVFLLNSILNSNKIAVLNNFYVYFRHINTESVSFNPNETYLTGLINAYKLVCDLFDKHSVDSEIQEIILANHMGFLTTQLIRSENSNDFDNQTLKEIVHSPVFNELSAEPIFKDNPLYVEFFENIKNEKYNNRPLLSKIRANTNTNLINGEKGLKIRLDKLNQEYKELTQENEIIKQSNTELLTVQEELKTNNTILNETCEKLTNENNVLINSNNNLIETQKELQTNYSALTDEKKQLQNNYNTLTDEKNQLQNNYNTLTNEKNQLQNNYNTLTNEKNQLQTNLTKLTNDHNALKNHDADLTYLNKKLKDENENLESKYVDMTNKYDELIKFNYNLRNNIKTIKEDFTSLKKLQIRIDDENKFLKNKNQNLNNELDEIKSSRLWKLKNKF